MTATDIKKFYNDHFFVDGQEKDVHMVLSFETTEGKICKIPGIRIWQHTTVGEIFHTYHEFLKENGAVTTGKTDVGEEVEKVVTVEYRKNEYLVQHYVDGSLKIRKPDGSFLNLASPTAKAVLKEARESGSA